MSRITRRRLLTVGWRRRRCCSRLRLARGEPELPRARPRLRRMAVLPRAAADRRLRAGPRVRAVARCRRTSAPTATPSRALAGVAAPRRATGFADWRLAVDGAGRGAGGLLARRAAGDAGAQPDHPARLRRGLERDRQVDRRAARGSCSGGCGCAPDARFIVLHCADDFRGTRLLREHRPRRRLPPADDPRLRHERRRPAGRPRRAAAAAGRAAARLQAREVRHARRGGRRASPAIGGGQRRLLGGPTATTGTPGSEPAQIGRTRTTMPSAPVTSTRSPASGTAHAGLEPRRPGDAVDRHLAVAVVEGDDDRLAADHLVGAAVQRRAVLGLQPALDTAPGRRR